ncbi:MAG: AMP-binding protein, partial [Betaproteobacteria bacterium]|nr:AMP-binding protein [Betaproteobacteria bacterium]
VYRLADALRQRGIAKGDRVALLLRNSTEMLEAHFSVPQLGAIIVPINTRLNSEEIAYILDHSGAKALILDTDLASLVEPIRDRVPNVALIIRANISERHGETSPKTILDGPEYESFIAQASPEPFVYPVDDEDLTISVNYTSGTTGRPKGVMYTHRGAYLNALGEIIQAGLNSNSNYLWTLPMFHCNGWCFPWTMAANAGTSICLRKVDAGLIFKLIREQGVTHYCGAPIVHQTLINAPEDLRKGIAHKVNCLVAGAAPPAAIIEGMEKMGFSITHIYGLTETYGPASVCAKQPEWGNLPLGEQVALNGRQGVRYTVEEGMTVMNPETMRPVPADGETMGEIMMRGNITMKGYLKNPEATQEAFRGGWFHTGDLAVMQPDGYVKIKDRSKDVIISGGENISSIEVEDTLYRHPAVMAAAVVAQPDAKWGETPCAFVELKEGARASEAEIIEFCRAHMARFKVPKRVLFGVLPKTSTGKIQKFVLRETAKSSSAIDT